MTSQMWQMDVRSFCICFQDEHKARGDPKSLPQDEWHVGILHSTFRPLVLYSGSGSGSGSHLALREASDNLKSNFGKLCSIQRKLIPKPVDLWEHGGLLSENCHSVCRFTGRRWFTVKPWCWMKVLHVTLHSKPTSDLLDTLPASYAMSSVHVWNRVQIWATDPVLKAAVFIVSNFFLRRRIWPEVCEVQAPQL